MLSIFARGAAGELDHPAFPAPSPNEGHRLAKARAPLAPREGCSLLNRFLHVAFALSPAKMIEGTARAALAGTKIAVYLAATHQPNRGDLECLTEPK